MVILDLGVLLIAYKLLVFHHMTDVLIIIIDQNITNKNNQLIGDNCGMRKVLKH